MTTYKEILSKYLPEKAVPLSMQLLQDSNVQLRITRARSTKLGDYRPPLHRKYHRISVNHDLNKYHFLITLVHEFAHLKNWDNHGRDVKPHGLEWKKYFSELLKPFLELEIFPSDLKEILMLFLKNPTSSSVNTRLVKKLRDYDIYRDVLTLEDLPDKSLFRIYNGIVFQKIEKMRKRYKCLRIDTQRFYMVSPVVQVIPVKDS